ncbi:hypothetical protein L6R29_17595 [Myxococcota bacterium]|nr:hypothetical protein [Myxococcota bacterium]
MRWEWSWKREEEPMRVGFWFWRGGGEEERWARAWGEALGERMGGWEVAYRELEGSVSGVWGQAFQRGMGRVLDSLPGWGVALYEKGALWAGEGPWSLLRGAYGFSALEAFLEVDRSEVVVAFHPMVLLPLLALKREGRWGGLVVGALGDLVLHRSWLQPGVGRYVVVHGGVEDGLVEGGIAREKVRVMGVPLGCGGRKIGREEACEALGLEVCEAWGLVDLSGASDWEGVCFQMSLVRSFRWLVYGGEGAEAQGRLREAAKRAGLRAKMLGGGVPWERLWSAVDLCVMGASLCRMYGALGAGVPTLFWEASNREERNNGGYLCEEGMGLWVREQALAAQIAEVSEGSRLEEMRRRISGAFSARTSEDWVSLLVETAVNREKIEERDRALLSGELVSLRRSLPAGVEAITDPRRLLTDGRSQGVGEESWYEDIGEERWYEDIVGEEKAAGDPSGRGMERLRDALAALILREKRLVERFDQLWEQVERWGDRVERAQGMGDQRLYDEANEQKERYLRERESIEEALRRLRREKISILERVKPADSRERSWLGVRGEMTEGRNAPRQGSIGGGQVQRGEVGVKESSDERALWRGGEKAQALDMEAMESKFREADIEGELKALKQRMKIQRRDIADLRDEDAD